MPVRAPENIEIDTEPIGFQNSDNFSKPFSRSDVQAMDSAPCIESQLIEVMFPDDSYEYECNSRDNCECVMCIPSLKDETKSYAPKNYSRVKIKSKTKEVAVKAEPEINIVDSGKSSILMTTEPEIEFVDVGAKDNIKNKSTFIQKKQGKFIIASDVASFVTIKTEPAIDIDDASDSTKVNMEKEIQNNIPTELALTEKNLVSIPSSEQLNKSSNTLNPFHSGSENTQPASSTRHFPIASGPLLELTTRNIKCNICGMVFMKSLHQLQTLKTHFLQHKNSVTKVIKKYAGVKYSVDELIKKPHSPDLQPRMKETKVIHKALPGGQYRVDKLNQNAKSPAQEKYKRVEQLNEFRINNTTLKRVLPVKGKPALKNDDSKAERNRLVNDKIPVKDVLPKTKRKHVVLQLAIASYDNLETSLERPKIRVASSDLKNNLDQNIKTRKLIKIRKPDNVVPLPTSFSVQPDKKRLKKESGAGESNKDMKNIHAKIKEHSQKELLVGSGKKYASSKASSAMDLDNDDDILIVEEKPELIVIDDNDDDMLYVMRK